MDSATLTLKDLDYDLPEGLIAQAPLAERDAARLLVVDRATGALEDRIFAELPALIRDRDLLVVNDTRVRRARIRGAKESGGAAEALLLAFEPPNVWRALIKSTGRLRLGLQLRFGRWRAELVGLEEDGVAALAFSAGGESDPQVIPEEIGEVPIPPYIRGGRANAADARDYQTIFADRAGSVAAPTASLHFTPELAAKLEIARITLEVGPGTFRPIRTERIEDHVLGREGFSIPGETERAIERARRSGGRVIAVGTTVVRALEAAGGRAGSGATHLLISPGYSLTCIDSLITNFHLPQSSLLALVMALCGVELTRKAYAHAVATRYRFYSYGDAMWIK